MGKSMAERYRKCRKTTAQLAWLQVVEGGNAFVQICVACLVAAS